MIVCHKEAGIPVQSARLGQKDMVSVLNNYLMDKGENVRVEVVHRLDQPVEGIIVFSKNRKAASELGKQLQQNRMHKVYQAVCCVKGSGETAGEKAVNTDAAEPQKYVLADYLAKDGCTNLSSVVNKSAKDAKLAELAFEVKKTATDAGGKKYLLAEIELKTGRHHQIRVQMSHAGLPLYGDQKYNEVWQDFLTETDQGRRNTALGLCAVSLAFQHPVNGKPMEFRVSPKAEVFQIFR